MRNFNEVKAEIFLRSEKRIAQRKKVHRGIAAVVTPLCLCAVILSAMMLPRALSGEGSYGAYLENLSGKGGADSIAPEGAYKGSDDELTGDAAFDAQYIRTNGYHRNVSYPFATPIRSKAELDAYYEEYKDIYYLERREKVYADTSIGFLDACDRYDEAFFEEKALVLVVLEEGSGSIRHNVTSVTLKDGTLTVSIDSIMPEAGTCDMAEWHIIVEVDRSALPDSAEDIIIE